tara:strand:+ start:279 stop:692 length:414 start_codon:yes stop_codon:yes gene_type:complete
MKRSELKKVLKPLIKECIREVVFEEGVLSGLISEVVKGTAVSQAQPLQTKNENLIIEQQEAREEYKEKIRETKKKMLDAIGGDEFNGVNLFEGTDPLNSAGPAGSPPSPASPLSNYMPEDSGVDISSLLSSKWKSLV